MKSWFEFNETNTWDWRQDLDSSIIDELFLSPNISPNYWVQSTVTNVSSQKALCRSKLSDKHKHFFFDIGIIVYPLSIITLWRNNCLIFLFRKKCLQVGFEPRTPSTNPEHTHARPWPRLLAEDMYSKTAWKLEPKIYVILG